MKRIKLLVIAFLLTNNFFGQTFIVPNNPSFDSVVVMPANPTENDSIKLIVYISNEIPEKVFYSLEPDNSSFLIKDDSVIIYALSMTPLPIPHDTINNIVDTFSIGKLISGNYFLLLINRDYSGYTTCYQCPNIVQDLDTAIIGINISTVGIRDENKTGNFPFRFSLTSGFLHIQNSKNINLKNINIRDIYYRPVIDFHKTNNNILIDVSHLSSGMYFIEVITEEQAVFIQKIIIF